MAAASSVQPDHRAGATGHRRGVKNRRSLLSHLHLQVQVPTVANAGFFHAYPKSAPSAAHASAHSQAHVDQPPSPSLLRSPSAWIGAKGQSFGWSKHTPRRPGNFHYDERSYAQNFDDGGDEDLDALRYRCFSPRLPTSPQPASPSGLGISGGNGKEACR